MSKGKAVPLKDAVVPAPKVARKDVARPAQPKVAKVKMVGSKTADAGSKFADSKLDVDTLEFSLSAPVNLGEEFVESTNKAKGGTYYKPAFSTGPRNSHNWTPLTPAQCVALGVPEGAQIGVALSILFRCENPNGTSDNRVSVKGKKEVTIDADVLASLIEVVKASQK